MTYSENSKHSYRNNFSQNQVGERNANAKLNWEKVNKIRKMSKKNGGKYKNTELAKIFGITHQQISSIINKKQWTKN